MIMQHDDFFEWLLVPIVDPPFQYIEPDGLPKFEKYSFDKLSKKLIIDKKKMNEMSSNLYDYKRNHHRGN